jgi:hypothetical protein
MKTTGNLHTYETALLGQPLKYDALDERHKRTCRFASAFDREPKPSPAGLA